MTRAQTLAGVMVVFVLGGHSAYAQDLSSYRSYALDSSVDAVRKASGSRVADAKTRHERPARIQELEWRAPYVSAGAEMADPVRTLTFMFYNDALYQITASYDRDRIQGLTTADIVATLSTAYGDPLPSSARAAARKSVDIPADMTLLAAWDSASASVLLLRGAYSTELQLMVVSKALAMQAKSAIREAERLDVVEGPRRESERRKQEAVETDAAREKAKAANKAAFRP